MKNYTITVNGKMYDVTVEERTGAQMAVAPTAVPVVEIPKVTPAVQAPIAAPVVETPQAVAEAPVKAASSGTMGSMRVEAGAAGKIFKLEANIGQFVKAGDSILVLEAMKMEIPVVAPQDGTVVSIDVNVGDTVEAGTLLATLN